MFYVVDKCFIVDYDPVEELRILEEDTLCEGFWLSWEWNAMAVKKNRLRKVIKLQLELDKVH